jgi:hypothetical protein
MERIKGVEPLTSKLATSCSPTELHPQKGLFSGLVIRLIKTGNRKLVGPRGFEPLATVVSGQCSTGLSYGPDTIGVRQ